MECINQRFVKKNEREYYGSKQIIASSTAQTQIAQIRRETADLDNMEAQTGRWRRGRRKVRSGYRKDDY
jgi:hypothetical protein